MFAGLGWHRRRSLVQSQSRLFFMRVGHLAAAFCFAVAVGLGVVATWSQPVKQATPTAPNTAETAALEQRLREQASENARLAEQLVALRGHMLEELGP